MSITALLAAMVRADPGRPRITCYDDRAGTTQGERVELSAKVLTNWVNKAANALQEEWDLGPGSSVALTLTPHWRTLYWALATWSVGATLVLPETTPETPHATESGSTQSDAAPAVGANHGLPEPDLTIAASLAALPAGAPGVFVTEAALARGAGMPLPPTVLDEAGNLANFADTFAAWADPMPDDAALRAGASVTAYAALIPPPTSPAGTRAATHTTDTATFLRAALDAYACGGSLVVTLGGSASQQRLDTEGVTRQV